jgi:hypothetical protein
VNGRIVSIKIVNPGINYTRAFAQITDQYGSGALLSVKLRSDSATIRSYYYKSNGEKVFVNEDAGTINYKTGRIILDSLNPLEVASNDFYDQDILTFNVVPENTVIDPLRNRILAIDTNNIQAIQLRVTPETA